jgi:hypothetical protein
MKRVIVVLMIAVFLVGVLAAPALAASDVQRGLKGADQLLLGMNGATYDNPGAMFQAVRDLQDMNPAQWAKGVRGLSSVGEFIYERGQAANY